MDTVDLEEKVTDLLKSWGQSVIKYAHKDYGGYSSPLFPDGINISSCEPAAWKYKGNTWIITNFANQQNFMRTLTAISILSGDRVYREAAEEAAACMFSEQTSSCGLLYWGGHQFVDLKTGDNRGEFDADCHEFKTTFPFYDLLWEVDPRATAKFIRAFWNAHVLDWKSLDMNRHGQYELELGELWDSEYNPPGPFFYGKGLTFINCGTDLIYAAALLYDRLDDKGALVWSKRMAEQYVKARHPETGLGAYQYSRPEKRREIPDDCDELPTGSYYGDRAQNQFGPEFGPLAREGWVVWGSRTRTIYVQNALIQLELAERLHENGGEFLDWTVEGLKAYAEYAYDRERNQFRPLWADGTDMTGYQLPRTGYFGKAGTVIEPHSADPGFLFSYARAHRLTGDEELWEMVRNIGCGNGLGDLGEKPGEKVQVDLETSLSDPEAVFALLEVYQTAPDQKYLSLASRIGENIIGRSLHGNFFLPTKNHIYTRFDCIEPLALSSLLGAIKGRYHELPVYSGGGGYLHGRYDGYGRTRDNRAIWDITSS